MNFIDIISKNKEWLFSGTGLFLISFIFKYGIEKFKKRPNVNTVIRPEEMSEENNIAKTQVEEISDRFNACLELMNINRNRDQFTVAWVAIKMELKKVSDLEDVFLNRSEASFELMEKFSEKFGINYDWLLEGKGKPFDIPSHRKLYALDYFDEIKSSEPEAIFFVRAKTIEGQTIIILKLCEYKFLVFKKDWHISDQVGGTGQVQLVSFYRLIKKLNENNLNLKCNGIFLEKEEFYKILNGEIFPGQYLNNIYTVNTWWDDLLDFECLNRSKEFYEKNYGASFVRAQEVLKHNLLNDH